MHCNHHHQLFTSILLSCYFLSPCALSVIDENSEPEKAADHIPLFTSEPKNISVEEGATITLECDVEKLEPFVIMWMKGVTPMYMGKIKTSQNDRVEMDPHNSMRVTIRNVNSSDEGNYICEIGTSIGKPPRLTHILHVNKEPHINARPPPGDVTVSEGEDVTLSCAAEGNPLPKITWKTEELDIQRGMILNGGNTLMFKGVVETDAGQYECIASNGVGNEARVVYTLRVEHAPKITIDKRLISNIIPVTLELVCMVKAEPQAKEISWIHGTQPVYPNNHIHILEDGHKLRLKITGLHDTDYGNYTCAATNNLGVIHKTVHVSGRPDPVKVKSRQQGSERNSYILEFTTQSVEPIINIQLLIREASDDHSPMRSSWREVIIPGKNTSPMRYSDRFEVTGLMAATVYEVMLKANNSIGWSDASEIFKFTTLGTLIEPPMTTRTLQTTEKSTQENSGLRKDGRSTTAIGSTVYSSKSFVAIINVLLFISYSEVFV